MFSGKDLFAAFSEKPSSSDKKRSAQDQKVPEAKRSKDTEDPVDDCPVIHRIDDNGRYIKETDDPVLSLLGDEVQCTHEVAYPAGETPPAQLAPSSGTPAREYPFTLDPFQSKAIGCIERNESVLVSAHTSAGKTVVAEYAIATSLRDHKKVIYTTPIKALSNQKFRELQETFTDVGLMTGDVTINQNCGCLVMTTEILRSMLYRGSELVREVAWVVFDEIHYMRDKERGVVWEETIILLPSKVHFVFLSATIPNAPEFASWVTSIHKQPTHVVYTNYRPTPLQHYVFPAGGDGLHLVVDEKGVFREDNFSKALASLAVGDAGGDTGGKKGKKLTGGKAAQVAQQMDLFKIVQMIMNRNFDPVIVFAFSKRECEDLATHLSKLDFNTEEEKQMVDTVFSNAMESLSDDDKKLPQVEAILPLLKNGVGMHHSGLLPLLKEVIEILFQEGLLKCLFATETFSMGLNMPAKTVVFSSVRKFDGENFRTISSGEYIQMSGRAGRRGLDERGMVILMVDEKMEPHVAKDMLKGLPDPLNSTFHLSYNMLLNLLRVEDADAEYVIRRSFYQFQTDRNRPALLAKSRALEAKRDEIVIEHESDIQEYAEIRTSLDVLKTELLAIVFTPVHCIPFIQAGRLAKVMYQKGPWGWGAVVNFKKNENKAKGDITYTVDVLLSCAASVTPFRPPTGDEASSIEIVTLPLTAFEQLSSIRIFVPKDLRSTDSRLSVGKSLKEVLKRFPNGVPALDPLEDMQIEGTKFRKLIRKIESLESKLAACAAFSLPSLDAEYKLYEEKQAIAQEAKAIAKQASTSATGMFRHELKCMKRVLRRLGYATAENVIDLKGRVACEINTADELVVTELMFNGVFSQLAVEQIVALLSCFVFTEKGEEQRLRQELQAPLLQLQEAAKRVATCESEAKLDRNVEEATDKYKAHLMEVVYSWCKGAKFIEICKLTEIYEGSIIRAMRRLEELLSQLTGAAKAIGNAELEEKFVMGSKLLKRDIVFASSLYL